MSDKIKKMYKNPMLFVLIVILIFYTPLAIYSPGESRNRGVVTAVGIDKIDDEYEVSLLTFIPTVNQSFEEQKSVISGKGNSVAQAVYRAQVAMGRKIGLFHAKTTIVNEELLNEDVALHLDYLSRVASLPENTVFVATNKTAKEVLMLSQISKNNTGLKLEQIVGFNAENLYVTDTSLEAFYEGYYSEVRSSIIGYLCVEDESSTQSKASVQKASVFEDMGSGMSCQNAQQMGENSSQKPKENLVNCGKSILIKNGKKAEVIDVDMLNAINLLNPKSKNQIIRIKDVEKEGKKVNLNFKVLDKKIVKSSKFENGYPVFVAKVNLGVNLVEVEGVEENLKLNTDFSGIDKEVAEKLDIEIKRQYADAITLLKKHNADVIEINRQFFTSNRKEYLNFIYFNGGAENFLNFVTFKLIVSVEPD